MSHIYNTPWCLPFNFNHANRGIYDISDVIQVREIIFFYYRSNYI